MSLLSVSSAFTALLEDIQVERKEAGTRVEGSWIEGAALDPINVRAVVQPASNRDVNELQLEGNTTASYKKFYSEFEFKTADSIAQTEADVIVYKSKRYKVLTIADWAAMGGYNKIMTVLLTD